MAPAIVCVVFPLLRACAGLQEVCCRASERRAALSPITVESEIFQ